jgi:hypothetical protein
LLYTLLGGSPYSHLITVSPAVDRAYSRCKQEFTPLSSTYTRLLNGALFILAAYSARFSSDFSLQVKVF